MIDAAQTGHAVAAGAGVVIAGGINAGIKVANKIAGSTI